jgi:hypothetical protein
MKSARETFKNDRSGDAQVGTQVKQLAATRNQAFADADQTFKTATSAARTALKSAFGSDASSV